MEGFTGPAFVHDLRPWVAWVVGRGYDPEAAKIGLLWSIVVMPSARRMGRAQRNPSPRRAAMMCFASLYPSYGTLHSTCTARTPARSLGSTSPSNHQLPFHQHTMRSLLRVSRSMLGEISPPRRPASVQPPRLFLPVKT